MQEMNASDFQMAAAEKQNRGLARELFGLLLSNKKWWLAPVLIVMLLIGLLIFLSGTPLAPFIYTLF